MVKGGSSRVLRYGLAWARSCLPPVFKTPILRGESERFPHVMSPVLRTRLLVLLGLPLAFALGRITAPMGTLTLQSGDTVNASGGTTFKVTLANGQAAETASTLDRGIAAASVLDPDATIDSLVAIVAKEPPGLARFALLHAALQRITRENWHSALVTMWKARAEGLINEDEVRFFLQRLGEAAGPAALEGFKPKDPVNAWETHSGRFAMMGWAMSDPAGAKAWLETQPPGRYHDGMLWGYALGLGLRDAPGALQAMQGLEPNEQRRLLGTALNGISGSRYQPLAEAWLQANAPTGDEAATGLRGQNNEFTHVFDQLLGAQIGSLSNEKKNEKFLAWVDRLDERPAAWFGPGSIDRISSEFARRDAYPEAVDWISRFTSDQPLVGARSMNFLMMQWTRADPASAGNWLNQNSASPIYDVAVAAFLNGSPTPVDTTTLQAWANTMHDPKNRANVLTKLQK